MARQRSQPTITLTAAAKRINMGDPSSAKRDAAKAKPWHGEAWGYFDEIPEIKESIRYRGNQLGKVRLFVAVQNPKDPSADPIPASDPDSGVPPNIAAQADEELARLRSRMGGQAEIMRMLDMNLEVVGEAYLVGYGERPEEKDPLTLLVTREYAAEDWVIRSVSEVDVKGSGASTKYLVKSSEDDTKGTPLDPELDTIMRIWLRHPRWANTADCAMRGLLGECRQLQVLCQQQLAHSYRALSAGILTIPNEVASVGPADPTKPEEPIDDPLMDMLYEVLSAPIEDPTHPSTVQPGLLRGPGAFLGSEFVRRISFYDAEQVKDIETRIEARVQRIARGLNLPVEKIMGHQACVTTDTLILTADGWRSHDQVRAGTLALTLNHRSGLAEWQPVQRVSVFDTKDQPLMSLEGQSHSSLSTLNHRWPVMTQRGARRWYDSDRLNTNCRLIPSASVAGLPVDMKWSDALVEVVAWYWTEGTRLPGGAMIYQSERVHPGHTANIRRALTDLVGPAEPTMYAASRKSGRAICSFDGCDWPIHAHGLCNAHRYQQRAGVPLRPVRRSSPMPPNVDERRPAWTERPGPDGMVRFCLNKLLAEELDVLAPDKVPTYDFLRSLTAAQLEMFIQRSTDGDGHRASNGTLQLHQSDPRRTDAFEFACVLSGRSVRRSQSGYVGGFSNGQSVRHLVTARWAASQRVGYGIKQEVVLHTGQVWCPTVENGTWLARRNGTTYFTGNTTYANAAQVDEDEFNDYLSPSADTAVEALTFAFLTPQLEAGKVAPEWVDRLFIWYDPSDLIAQPDAEAHAFEAHQANVISNAALRRSFGFGEDDAPEPLELLQRAGLRRGILTADLTHALLELLGIPIDVPEGGAAVPVDPNAEATAMLAQMLTASVSRPIRAASRPASNDYGRRLTELDRELRSRLITAANVAMSAALDRAANRLRTKTNGSPIRASLQTVPRRSWFAHLGPSLVAEAMGEEDPMAGAWDGLEDEFMAWGADAQAQARSVVEQATGRDQSGLADQQADDLGNAWHWLLAALSTLATDRLWNPDPSAPDIGEHDPTVMIPAGLIRSAISRAGGSAGLSTSGTDAWVTLTEGGSRPAGGIGTGETIRGALRDGGAQVEGYVWEYGPSFRQRPYFPHQSLNDTPFENFDDPVLLNVTDSLEVPYHFPGGHDGCRCDARPVILGADEQG